MALSQDDINNLWSNDFVQKNPRKSYSAYFPAEYEAISAFVNGGDEPDASLITSRLGKGLVAAEKNRRGTVVTPPVPPTAEPAPIAGQGYKIVFEDDFNTLDTATWRLGNWYTPEAPANYSVANSIVSIVNKPAEHTQRDLMTRSKAWQFGYFEMRARYTRNTSAWASIWMMSDHWIRTGDCTTLKVCEFDIVETFHNLENPTTYRSHSSTLHRNTSSYCGLPDEHRDPSWTNDVGFELAENWRTYAGLWTAAECSTYVDGKICKKWPVYDSTNQPMRVFLGMWSHSYSAEVKLDVDWFKVWQK
jgi:beta-glucanase (GH16 family)